MSRKPHKSERPAVVAGAPAATVRAAAAVPSVSALDEPKSGRGHFVRHKYNALGELVE